MRKCHKRSNSVCTYRNCLFPVAIGACDGYPWPHVPTPGTLHPLVHLSICRPENIITGLVNKVYVEVRPLDRNVDICTRQRGQTRLKCILLIPWKQTRALSTSEKGQPLLSVQRNLSITENSCNKIKCIKMHISVKFTEFAFCHFRPQYMRYKRRDSL